MTRQSSKTSKLITMRDVAKLAGVSQPTVSRVLNQKGTDITISEVTINKVMAAVEELGYRPNVLARSLRTQQTNMVALMIADITNSFYHPIARAVHDVAREHHFDVLIADSDHIYENEKHFCEIVTRRPVDGVIMVPVHLTYEDLDDFIVRSNTPVVILGHHINHPQIDVVFANDQEAVYRATDWLIKDKGHRRFGYVGVPDDLPPGPRRFKGFLNALSDSQLTIQPQHVVVGDFTIEGGREAVRQLIEVGDMPSVLVVANDLMAIGAILMLQESGYRVPEDVAVLGYDNIPEARIIRPALTTIVQDSVDIGLKLATALFDRIENPDIPARHIESLYQLAIRDSV